MGDRQACLVSSAVASEAAGCLAFPRVEEPAKRLAAYAVNVASIFAAVTGADPGRGTTPSERRRLDQFLLASLRLVAPAPAQVTYYTALRPRQ